MLYFFQLQNTKCSSEPMETPKPKNNSAPPAGTGDKQQTTAFSLNRIIQYSHTVLELCQGETQTCYTHKQQSSLWHSYIYRCFSKTFSLRPTIFHGNSIFHNLHPSGTLANSTKISKGTMVGSEGKSTSIPDGDGFRTCLVIRSKHHWQTHNFSLIPEKNWGKLMFGEILFLCK